MDDMLERAADCILTADANQGVVFVMEVDGTTTCTITREDGLPADTEDCVEVATPEWWAAHPNAVACEQSVGTASTGLPDTAMDPATQDNPVIMWALFVVIILIAVAIENIADRKGRR